jgi:predicted NAD/FAD-binding protein
MGSLAGSGYERKRIAVVGGGGAGLGALYALRNSQHSTTLYEAQSRLGGHMNPVEFRNRANDRRCKVETAFMIMNDETYRKLILPTLTDQTHTSSQFHHSSQRFTDRMAPCSK